MDIYSIFLAIIVLVAVALAVVIVVYMIKPDSPGREQTVAVPASGGIISVSYKSETGRSFNVSIRPDAFSEEDMIRMQRMQEEEARRNEERAAAQEPSATIDFARLNDFIKGRLDHEEAARMKESLQAVVDMFRPVFAPPAQEERLVDTVSRPVAETRRAEVPEEDGGLGGDVIDRLVRALSMPAYDNVLAVYVSDRLGLRDRVRRMLPEDEESLERYQMLEEELGGYEDMALAEFAFDKEPVRPRSYKNKQLEVSVKPRTQTRRPKPAATDGGLFAGQQAEQQ